MITEAEAKTKWCPFTFTVPEQRGPDGCGIREGGPWTCSASLCMAWRSGGTVRVDSTGKRVFGEMQEFKERIEVGYCGLAGEET